MPVLVKCPLCRGVMPDTRGEARCPRCRELVLPTIRKLCAGCGVDVTRSKRVRDEPGEYWCHDCWSAQLAARGEEPGYICGTCSGVYPSSQIYQLQQGDELICHACYADRNLDPNALLAAAAEAEPVSAWRQPHIYADAPAASADPVIEPADEVPVMASVTVTPGYVPGTSGRRQPFPWGLVIAIGVIIVAVTLFIIYRPQMR